MCFLACLCVAQDLDTVAILMEIEDSGEGMGPEHVANLFQVQYDAMCSGLCSFSSDCFCEPFAVRRDSLCL